MLDCEPELDPRLRKRGKGRGRGGSSAGSALDPSATTGVPLGPLRVSQALHVQFERPTRCKWNTPQPEWEEAEAEKKGKQMTYGPKTSQDVVKIKSRKKVQMLSSAASTST